MTLTPDGHPFKLKMNYNMKKTLSALVILFTILLIGKLSSSWGGIVQNRPDDLYAIAALTATSMICLTWICVTIIKTMYQKEDKP